jgi:hypothetical protein
MAARSVGAARQIVPGKLSTACILFEALASEEQTVFFKQCPFFAPTFTVKEAYSEKSSWLMRNPG